MITRTFRNGNVTIKHQAFFDGDMPRGFHEFPAWLAEHAPCDEFDVYEVSDFECWGNDYGAYYIKAFVNGELGYYPITPDDYEQYVTGKMLRIRRESLAPLFVLPPFFKCADNVDFDGVKGGMYWMESPLTDEQKDEIGWSGVKFLRSHTEYAPEITSDVVFVPNGTVFSFC